ncbi:hypothetical protein NDU88_001122 [Pleurodeles waltl]|uniref:Uncharacterized protein n=1 Tax=Pleurodeles waltl TaxID=8319 RepID=A0AAV7UW01_PLEWA|nr:hypothetical protein NDU88_001122 [Pleurodeles waltl]
MSGGTGPHWSCAGPVKALREFPFRGIAAAVAAEWAEQQPRSCGWESNPKRIQRREPGRKRKKIDGVMERTQALEEAMGGMKEELVQHKGEIDTLKRSEQALKNRVE